MPDRNPTVSWKNLRKICEKNQNGTNGILRGLGAQVHEKNLKSRGTVPLKVLSSHLNWEA